MTKKDSKTVKTKAVKTALSLAAEQGWDNVTLSGIAKEAGVTLSDLYEHFEDRYDILSAYGRMVDSRVLDSFGDTLEQDISPRDRLFDLIMERLDILNEDRAGISAILHSFRFDPKQAVISLPHLCRSMNWMLESSGISTYGFKGALKVAGLTALYLNVLRTWTDDDSPDMGKTMAALDKNLERAERWAGNLNL